jgi:alkylation response protein AidB-like acyl-CoA dehydrogenase
VNALSAAEQRVVAAARAFVAADVAPHVQAWDRGVADSRTALPAAAAAGLLGLEVPVAHGGLGLTFACKRQVAEILAAADFGLAMSVINTHNVAKHLAAIGAPEVKKQLLPALLTGQRTGCTALTEPDAGSDFSAITTLARKVGDEWQIDGRKAWIVNGTHAEVVVVYAQTEPGSGARGIAAFVVDGSRNGFVREAAADSTATRSIDAGGFALQGYRAKASEMLHPPGEAFKAALASINGARTYVAAMCCGMVQAALDMVSAYGVQRHTFGKPLHAHQGWRWSLADAAIDLAAARLLVDAATALIDQGRDAQTEAAQAKVFATRMASRHIAALMHGMGAAGLREQFPMMRHLAAAQVASLTDGSTEMLLDRVAASLRKAP